LRANRALNATHVTNGRVDALPYDGELDEDGMFDTLYYGDPDRITAKFRALGEAGATRISNWTMLGGIPHEKIMHSIKLMGEEVIPALKDFLPPPDLYRALSSQSDTGDALRSTGPIPS
jgi:alkanesulfonate monooxygenase SsuD/methylene tetrahydromethanopterin reductase-like flavin-dependent oxidoreductase (luciferase family)